MALLWLSLRVRWRRAWARCTAIVALVGLAFGFVLASAAAARSVDGTYRTLTEEIDAPDLVVIPGCGSRSVDGGCNEPARPVSDAELVAGLGTIPLVDHARAVQTLTPYFVDLDGNPLLATADDEFGCLDGDRSVVAIAPTTGGPHAQPIPMRLTGELPAAGSKRVVLSLATARRVGLGIGDRLGLAGWCLDGDPQPAQHVELVVSGLSVGPLDVEPPDRGVTIEPAYLDPDIVRQLVDSGADVEVGAAVWISGPVTFEAVNESLGAYEVLIDLGTRADAIDDALSSDARLLWLLAAVGALAGVLLLAPIVAKNLRDTAPDTVTTMALGASRTDIARQSMAHVVVLAAAAALVAVVLAPPISALLPRGFATAIAPGRAMAWDPIVLAVGAVAVAVVVAAMGALPASRSADRSLSPGAPPRGALPRGAARPGSQGAPSVWSASRDGATGRGGRRGALVRWASPRPGPHTGLLSAVGAPAGPRQSSPWPTFLSLVIAGSTCVACLTYLAGLRSFEETPSLSGWNWGAVVSFDDQPGDEAGQDPGQDPGQPGDPQSERAAAISAALARIDGVEQVTAGTLFPPVFLSMPDTDLFIWPWSFATGPGAVAPTMLSGRAPEGPDEVAIDRVFAEASGLTIGSAVTLTRPALASTLADEVTHVAIDRGLEALMPDRPDAPAVAGTFEVTGIAVLPNSRVQIVAQVAFTLPGLAAFTTPGDDEIAAATAWLPEGLPTDVRADAEELLGHVNVDGRSAYIRFTGDPRSTIEAIAAVDGVSEVIAPTPHEVLSLVIGLNLSRTARVPVALAFVVAIAAAGLLTYLLVTEVRGRRFELAVMRALGLTPGGARRSIATQATATAVIPLLAAVPIGVVIGRQAWLSHARDLYVVPRAPVPWPILALLVVAAVVVANVVALASAATVVRRSPDSDLRAS